MSLIEKVIKPGLNLPVPTKFMIRQSMKIMCFFISLKQTKKGEAGGEDAGHLLPNDPEYEWMNNQRFPSFLMRLFYPKPELQETCDISDCTRHFSNQCGIYKTDW